MLSNYHPSPGASIFMARKSNIIFWWCCCVVVVVVFYVFVWGFVLVFF